MAELIASAPLREANGTNDAPVHPAEHAQDNGVEKVPWLPSMNTSVYGNLMDEICEFLVSTPTLEQISEFHASASAQEYLRTLLDKNRQNTLRDAEREEFDQIMQLEHFVRRLKIWALRKREEAT